ncbi:ribosomal-protein-alanine N-acetyltransferase [Hathewaya proteolytica DSM 3090]|uniref:Ribosomal-protein-alanine N-acetyltransferase n=1 Tax=Hathewaya proteolytica DSM 3090 TaxID=1121331 RepID=A0A1M6M0Z0_9CLOT|nr:GNAT family N-acetyltransferase [Hathewaya proteolytica]SHJ77056.1 ribosomal-protein-alanine N-acetyltransferase [Hathewaya proteolytica DSM 3090]
MDIIIDISKTVLETDRLILRAWKESDLNDFFEYASVEGVGEMAGWPHHSSIEVSKKILKAFMDGKNVFAIVYKENGKVIGSLGMHESWANDEVEYKELKLKQIGYVLSKDYWGKGLMPEAVKELINFCFNKCGVEALTIGHFLHNNQSKRVIEKCGFKFVKQSKYVTEQGERDIEDMKYILYP